MFQIELRPVAIGKRVIKIRRTPPSLNARMHWAVRAKWTEAWKASVAEELQSIKATKNLGKIKIIIHNHAIRPCDTDNMFASIKPITDAIVQYGIVEDDSSEFVKYDYETKKVHHRVDERFFIQIISVK